jgi:aquaporin Z
MKLNVKDLDVKNDYRSEEFASTAYAGRRFFSETWGTFLLVMVAAGGHMVAEATGKLSLAVEVIAPGMMVMAIIYFMGTVSGAHLNPAVTLAFALRRHFPWTRVPAYIIAQLIGATLACLFLRYVLGEVGDNGATIPGEQFSQLQAFLIEIAITTGLVNTILGTASGPRNIGTNGGIAVGAYIALAGMWSAAVSGTSMNPARSFAPDIVRGDFTNTWIYIAGPIIGACIAVCFEWILKGKPSKHATEEAQGLGRDKDEEE